MLRAMAAMVAVLVPAAACAQPPASGSERIRAGFGAGLLERVQPHAGLEHAHDLGHMFGTAMEALRVDDLRHEHAVGQRG